MNPIGIMQGRLSPPVGGRIQSFPTDTWREEFGLAQALGLDCLEWLYDTASYQDNPLLTESGMEEVRDLCKKTGIEIWSVCGDYFRDFPLIRVSNKVLEDRLQTLRNLIILCQRAGIRRIMIPFVDSASILTESEFQQAREALGKILPFAQAHNVVITLETSLPPEEYRNFLERVNHRALGVTYDIGDCASLGHDLAHEIKCLEPWLEVVHVKDRQKGGGTLPLGTGEVDFDTVFAMLAAMRYKGPFILQCAREETGNEITTAKKNLQFVRHHLIQTYTTIDRVMERI